MFYGLIKTKFNSFFNNIEKKTLKSVLYLIEEISQFKYACDKLFFCFKTVNVTGFTESIGVVCELALIKLFVWIFLRFKWIISIKFPFKNHPKIVPTKQKTLFNLATDPTNFQTLTPSMHIINHQSTKSNAYPQALQNLLQNMHSGAAKSLVSFFYQSLLHSIPLFLSKKIYLQ